jgi:hypothetical protein
MAPARRQQALAAGRNEGGLHDGHLALHRPGKPFDCRTRIRSPGNFLSTAKVEAGKPRLKAKKFEQADARRTVA